MTQVVCAIGGSTVSRTQLGNFLKVVGSWLLVLLWICPAQVRCTVSIPHAFSQNHKSENVKTLSIERMKYVLSRFQLDTHMEVVLLGESMSNSAMPVDALLEKMSATSSVSSPLTFVHEKLVYHVVYSDAVTRRLEDVMSGADRVSPTIVEQVLLDHHNRGSAATSLYVLLRGLREKVGSVQYESSHPSCRHGAFLSDMDSFAWIDLAAQYSNILPTYLMGEIFMPPNISVMLASADKNHQLASFVHASGQALVPFPYHPFSSLLPFAPEQQTRVVHLLLITLCMDSSPANECTTNPQAAKAAARMKTLYGASNSNSNSKGVQVIVSTLEYSLRDEPSLAHAVYSSMLPPDQLVDYSSEDSWGLSPDRLVDWLTHSATFRDTISRQLSSLDSGSQDQSQNHRLLPVLTVSVAPHMQQPYWAKNGGGRSPLPFFKVLPEPPDGWGLHKLDKQHRTVTSIGAMDALDIASRLQWPPTIVLHAVAGDGTEANFPSDLQCDGALLFGDRLLLEEELFYTVREAVWGVLPPSVHYSEASRAMVRDYVWFTPSFLRTSKSTGNRPTNNNAGFRDKQAVSRAVFVHRAESILKRFATLLDTLQGLMPAHNVTQLLGTSDHLHVREAGASGATTSTSAGMTLQQKYSSARNKQQQTTFSKADVTGKTNLKSNEGLFARFLRHMDDAATDFSHLDFDFASMKLNNAETIVVTVEREAKLAKDKANRLGAVTCFASNSDSAFYARPPSSFDDYHYHRDNQHDGSFFAGSGEDESEKKRDEEDELGKDEAVKPMHEKPAWLTWAFVACGALLGIGLAIPAGNTKAKLGY